MIAVRVAFVITGGVDPGGRERVVPSLLWLIERMARRHDVVVYVLRYFSEPRRYSLLGATIQDLGRPEGIRRQYSALLDGMRRDGPFDLVHAYWGLPAGFAATLVAKRLGLPSIVTLDSGEFAAVPAINYGLQLRWRQRLAVSATCRLATRLTVCSRYQLSLAKAHRVSADLIPLGVDTRLFVPPPPLRPLGPPWRLIHVASLNRVKDQPTLVEAMRQLLTRTPDVHLDIVGEDTLGGAIQRLVMSAGIDRHVTFHGFQHSDAIVPLYQQAHLAILSSLHEAAGVVTLEAAACGIPTIGSDVGYVADWAPDAAVAVRPGDPAALASAIERALADPEILDRIAARACAWTLEHDADWTAAEFDRLYHAAAG
jgi:glycosyltransferase involved in cell wall biosynthesis